MKIFRSTDIVPIKEKTAVALGYFDSVHIGHKAVIKAAVNSGISSSVFTFSGGKNGNSPILTDEEKLAKIEMLGVDYCVCPKFYEICNMSGRDFFTEIIIGKMNASKVYCGSDFKFGKDAKCGVEELKTLCENSGVELTVVPFVMNDGKKISTTMIRELISNGFTGKAEKLL